MLGKYFVLFPFDSADSDYLTCLFAPFPETTRDEAANSLILIAAAPVPLVRAASFSRL